MTASSRPDISALVRAHSKRLRRFFNVSGVAPTEAEDLVQSTFLVLLKKDAGAIENVDRYLWGIAHNMLKKARTRLRTYEEFHSSLFAAPTTALSNKVERQIRFSVLLGRLKDDEREVFLMRCEGLTIPQIAAAVELSEPTVKRRLLEARRQIDALAAETATPDDQIGADDIEDSYRES